MTVKIDTLLDKTVIFLEQLVAPCSMRLDNDVALLRDVFTDFKALNALSLLIPEKLGGLGGVREDLVKFNILLSQYSSTLLFLQGQHQYAIITLLKHPINKNLRELCDRVVHQQIALGISLSGDKFFTQVRPCQGGFVTTGTMPWVSGFGLLDYVLFSFSHNEIYYLALLPFKHDKIAQQGVTFSEPVDVVVANAVNTVKITLSNYIVKKEDIIAATPRSQITTEAPPHPHTYSLAGVAKALLDKAPQSRHFHNPIVQAKYQQLRQKLDDYTVKILAPLDDPLTLRALGMNIANLCSLFTLLVFCGSSLKTDNEIQRLLREVWLYSATGLSDAQVEKCIDSITPPDF